MFRFGAQQLLLVYLVLPVVVVFFWYAARHKRRAVERFGDMELMRRLSDSVNRRAQTIKKIVTLAVLAALITALARPQFGTRVETVTREGQDIVVAIDVSASMLAEDIVPNRLEKAKHEVASLIGRLRGDRIGLVVFAGEAFVQSPLTVDYGAAMMFLNAIGPDIIPVPGTDLGLALDVSLDAFDETERQHRALVIITDGEDHEEEIGPRIERAVEAGVRVYTVGMGSPDGVPIPEFDAAGVRRGFKRDENGEVVTTRLDEQTLQRIAQQTGGRYFRATTAESELNELTDEVDALGARQLEALELTQFEEQYQIFLAIAMALLVIELVIPERRRMDSAWRGRLA